MSKGFYVGVRPNVEVVELPNGYTQIEYIESTGTQYINTGFKPNQDTRVILDTDITSAASDFSAIFGSRINYDNTAFSVWVKPDTFHSDYANGYIQNQMTPSTLGRYIIDKNKNITTAKDMVITHNYTNFQCVENMLIGTVVNNGTPYKNGLIGKIYSCQIYDNGVLVRDYIPVINSDGAIGLFDLVSQTFFGNAGTGTFIAGNDVSKPIPKKGKRMYVGVPNISEIRELPEGYEQVEYIESTGTQYIDTGFKPNQDTHVIMDVELSTQSTYPKGLFGSRNGSTSAGNSFIMWLISATAFRTDYGNASGVSMDIVPIGRFLIDKNGATTTINNTTYTATVETFQSDYNLTLMAENDVDGVDARMAEGKLYSCQIYDNDVLIRDYVPAINSEGKPGLFDLITSTFYTNAGTGDDFLAGNTYNVDIKNARKAYIGVPTGIELRETPKGYAQLEYIEFGENQYIDTRFKPNQDTRALLDIEITNIDGTSKAVFGARDAKNSNGFAVYPLLTKVFFDYGTAQVVPNHSETNNRVSIDLNKNNMSYGNTSNVFTKETFACSYNAFLGSVNNGGQPYDNKSAGKIYSCKIWDNDILVRDYIPVKSPNGIVGMYDFVTKSLFATSNNTNFIAGPVAKESVARLFYFSQQIGTITVSPGSRTISGLGKTSTATITYNGDGAITAVSSNTSIATCSLSGNTVTVTSKGKGNAKITISIATTEHYLGASCQLSITVKLVLGYYGAVQAGSTRNYAGAATNDNYAIFIGGTTTGWSNGTDMDTVETFNKSLTRGTASNLIQRCMTPASATIGSYATFYDYNRVDYAAYYQYFYTFDNSLTRTNTKKSTISGLTTPYAATTFGTDGALYVRYLRTESSADVTVYRVNTSMTWTSATDIPDQNTGAGEGFGLASVGNYAIMAGGRARYDVHPYVNAFNKSLTRTIAADLSSKREVAMATTVGNYAIFAGGSGFYYGENYDVVEAYNSSLTKKSVASLSGPPYEVGVINGITLDGYALFANGNTKIVDTYNSSLTKSTTTNLSKIRESATAAAIGNYALFLGGYEDSTTRWADADVYQMG